jgi:penicillin-binding protein 2
VELQRTDFIGKSGLEREYDDYLRGSPGVKRLAVDNKGLVTGVVSDTRPVAGAHLVTSIDARVQAVAEKQLQAAIIRARTEGDINKGGAKRKADAGAVVVMEVKTGRVVAMASYPTYDPKIWVGGIDPTDYAKISGERYNFPMINRVTQGDFVAASTFKIITMPAAIMAGYDLNGSYTCPASFSIPGRSFANYESRAYGAMSLERAINVSCDTIFYRWAYQLYLRDGGRNPKPGQAKDHMINMALAYGLGRRTGIDLPGERPGRIVTRESKKRRWEATRERSCYLMDNGYKELEKTEPAKAKEFRQYSRENCLEGHIYRGGDAVNFSIGQGDTSVTPLQMTRAYAAVANGGTLWVPQLAKALVSTDGKVLKKFAPKKAGKLPVDKKVLAYLQRALKTTTDPGTGGTGNGPFRRANFPVDRIPVASKTGTGEAGKDKDTTSWFASYAPANDPQFAVVMVISQGGTGSGISGPSVAEIYKKLFGVDDAGNVDPSKAIYPDRKPIARLPVIAKDGTIKPPSAPKPKPAPGSPSALAAAGLPERLGGGRGRAA